MEDNNILNINRDLLENIITASAKKFCGKCMKRFEISRDIEEIKKQVKELAYESYRDLFQLIIACNNRKDLISIYFNNK